MVAGDAGATVTVFGEATGLGFAPFGFSGNALAPEAIGFDSSTSFSTAIGKTIRAPNGLVSVFGAGGTTAGAGLAATGAGADEITVSCFAAAAGGDSADFSG